MRVARPRDTSWPTGDGPSFEAAPGAALVLASSPIEED